MKATVCLFLVLPFAVQSYLCPEEDVCKCSDVQLSCVCTNTENVTLQAILNSEIQKILVKGCGSLIISMDALLHLDLKEVVLEELNKLTVRPFAFSASPDMDKIVLSSILNLDIMPNGFSGLHNIGSLTIHDVAAEKLESQAFGSVDNVGNVTISNSIFREIEPRAFGFSNITQLMVKNSSFHNAEDASIAVHSAKSVLLSGSNFEEVGNSSLSFASVDNLVFDHCTFRSISSMFLATKDVQNMVIEKCSFDELKTGAFSAVDVPQNLIFSNNIIWRAEKNSILPNAAISEAVRSGKIIYASLGNMFSCDCNASWIWTDNNNGMYDTLINTSNCISNHEIKLISLTPLLNSEKMCVKISNQTNTGNEPNAAFKSSFPVPGKSYTPCSCRGHTEIIIPLCVSLILSQFRIQPI